MQEWGAFHPSSPWPADAVLVAMAELSTRLDRMRNLAEASSAVAECLVDRLGVDLAGVTQRLPGGVAGRLAITDDVLTELDTAAVRLGQGPGSFALHEGAVITVGDTRDDRRWPVWSAEAAERGVLSACLVGMPPMDGGPVSLDLFSRRTDAFADDELAGLMIFGRLAGVALRQIERRTNLEQALTTRDLIGRAQGIIMERYDLTSDQAMDYLRRSSQDAQEKIHQIARRLVTRADG